MKFIKDKRSSKGQWKNKRLAFSSCPTMNNWKCISHLHWITYVVNASNLGIHRCARLNHTLRCSRIIISRTEIVSGPWAGGGSITIVVAVLSRETMQNCRRERSLGCIKLLFIGTAVGSPPRAPRVFSQHICRKLPPLPPLVSSANAKRDDRRDYAHANIF